MHDANLVQICEILIIGYFALKFFVLECARILNLKYALVITQSDIYCAGRAAGMYKRARACGA